MKKTTFAINASICPIYLFFQSVSRAIHTDMRKKKSGEAERLYSRLPRRDGKKRESPRDSTGTWRVKDTAKKITVEYHVRNRAIASTRIRDFSNASIDRETAPLSPKLPCLPRWITSSGRSCTLKDNGKEKKIRARLRKNLPPPA